MSSSKSRHSCLIKKIQFCQSFMTLKDEAIPVPMFWTNETMKLDEETTEDVYNNSVFPMKVVNAIQYTLFALGGALILIAFIDLLVTGNQVESLEVESEEMKEKKSE